MLPILLEYLRETDLSKKSAEPHYEAEVEYLDSGHGLQNTNCFNVTVGLLRHISVGEVFWLGFKINS